MRTPLFRAIRRLFRQAQRQAAGLPPEAPPKEGPSRREMLGGTLAAAAALPLLGACKKDGGGDEKIVIVGGGMAGIHCAYRLGEVGLKATIYDANTRVGGRMYTDRTTFGDQLCELGGELIDSNHETMRALATQFGLQLDDFTNDAAGLSATVGYFNGTKYEQAALLTAFADAVPKITASLDDINPGDPTDNYVSFETPQPNGAKYDDMTIKQWLNDNTSGLTKQLLDVAYNIEYGLETEQQSVLNMLYLIGTDEAKLELFGDSDELFHTHLGNESFIDKLKAALAAEQIVLQHKLTAITQKSDMSYELVFDNSGKTVTVAADHVVLALPFTMLRQVTISGFAWPAQKKKAIDEIGYGTNAKLMVGFSSRIWRTQNSGGETFTDEAFQATWETSRGQSGDAGIITNFVGGNHGASIGSGTPESQRDAFLDGFDKVFPGAKAASNGKQARMHWPTNPFVLGSYACYKPGQWRAFAGEEQKRVGNIHFCGEHTSSDFQGYMEGAAETGAAAAEEIASDLGKSSSAIIQGQIVSLGAGPQHPSWRIWARARAIAAGAKRRRRGYRGTGQRRM